MATRPVTGLAARGAPLEVPRERRVHTGLRAVFESALALVEPCFNPQNAWSGVCLEHTAYRLMRERYPHLGISEIHAFLVAARHVYGERRISTPRSTF